MKKIFLGGCCVLLLLAGCGEPSGTAANSSAAKEPTPEVTTAAPDADPRKNTDPKKGWVTVYRGTDAFDWAIYKLCDGSTLMYAGDVEGVVPNSPACK